MKFLIAFLKVHKWLHYAHTAIEFLIRKITGKSLEEHEDEVIGDNNEQL